MSHRTASIVSVTLSLLLLFIFSILLVIFEMIAMNDATEKQATAAIGISLICLSAGAIVLGLLAWKTAHFLITRFNLHPILAVTLTVATGMLLSGMIVSLILLVSIPLAGIR